MTIKVGHGPTQIEITEKLKQEMGRQQFEALMRVMQASPNREILDVDEVDKRLDQMLDDIMGGSGNMIAKMPKHIPAATAQQGAQRNYEAAIYSRLAVLEGTHHSFDMIKVHRTRDATKFYVFIVTNDKWVVLEDDELFPSDKLISALRCLTL